MRRDDGDELGGGDAPRTDDRGRRSYEVEVAGIGGGRGGPGRSALVGLIAVLAILIGGLLSSELFPVDRGAVRPTAPAVAGLTAAPSNPAAPTASLAVPTPAFDGPLTARITADPVDVVALVGAIPRHGTGPLAFVSGRLHATRRPCTAGAPLSACLVLRLDGLRGAAIVPDDSMAAWPGDPPAGVTLALLPRDGHLVFLGWLVVDSAGIPRIDVLQRDLGSDRSTTAAPQPTLREADGMLVAQAVCPSGSACGETGSALFPTTSFGSANLAEGIAVSVVPKAFGVTAGGWTSGPFLLRYDPSNPIPWLVVAREDQGSVLHVVIP